MLVKAPTVYPLRYPTLEDKTMNAFFQHHKSNIAFDYRCFDRLLLNATILDDRTPRTSEANLRQLRERAGAIIDRYLDAAQQDQQYVRDDRLLRHRTGHQ
jgi:hypothetical protein